jgi:hypothetical protein
MMTSASSFAPFHPLHPQIRLLYHFNAHMAEEISSKVRLF